MKKGKIIYKGHFSTYFFASLGLIVLSVITFGIALPYYVYWTQKYFFDNMEIELYEQDRKFIIGNLIINNVVGNC